MIDVKKVLSIVIPVYNTEKYIKRCIDSIVGSDYVDDIELIIVSDGSADSSISIVKEYIKKYPKSIFLIEKENGGHGSTINAGLRIASGKYFRVIDSDDWVSTIDFDKYILRLKNEDCDLVVTNYSQEHIYSGTSINYNYSFLNDNIVYNFNDFDLNDLNGEYFVMATSTYKTSLINNGNVSLFEKTFYVDMQYNVQTFLNVTNFVYYDLNVYKYFIGRKDQSNNYNSFVKNKLNHEKVIKYLIDFYVSNKDVISSNRLCYYKKIIYYMLYTHYTIYCIYDNNKFDAYKNIKRFDKYLKDSDAELYNISNIGFVKLNRYFGFIFVLLGKKITNLTLSFVRKFR